MGVTRIAFAAPNNVVSVQVAPGVRDVQAGVERFRLAMVGRYQTPTGSVIVSTPFGMNVSTPAGNSPGYVDQRDVFNNRKLRECIKKVAKDLGYLPRVLARVNASRGAPPEIRQLGQGLVDNPPPNMTFENPDTKIWTPGDVRRLMHLYSLCVDCAGYVQQAYLRAWGRTRAQANFSDILNEDLAGLSGRGYQKIIAVADVKPGDIVVLEDASPVPPGQPRPVGHRAIVYDQRVATDDDLVPLGNEPTSAQSFKQGGPIRALELDSSWGSGGYYASGGVQRRLFLFNESTRTWANTKWDEYVGWDVHISDMLYDHLLDGFCRRQGD